MCTCMYYPMDVMILFIANFCNLLNSKTDDFDWTRGSNGTSSLFSGPQVDHTTGTQFGHFAYIDSATDPLRLVI